jgi:radical SAM protein with 4Fe4S-binding SPASM domain
MPRKRVDPIHEPPLAIVMEPHTYCNLTCWSCLTGRKKLQRPLGRMLFAPFRRLVDEVSEWVKVVHWSGMGEPLLFEDSLDYLSYLSQAGINVRIDTNGHFFGNRDFVTRLIHTGVSEINIALDGINQKSLSAIRGSHADFKLVVDGIRMLMEVRDHLSSSLKVNLQFIISKPNEDHIKDFLALATALRPDSITLKAIRLDPGDRRACRKLMPLSESYCGYIGEEDGKWQLKGEMLNQCWAIRAYCVIWWDGTLLPCCFDLQGKYAFGNVFDSSFREAWNSDLAVSFRRLAATHLPSIPMCEICPVGRDIANCWEIKLGKGKP